MALRWDRRRAALAIQASRPRLGSALEAYLEGRGGLLRARLEAWLAERVGVARPPLLWLLAAAALAVASLGLPRRVEAPRPTVALPPTLSLSVRVEPPAYTGWASVEAQPPLVRGLRHSVVRLDIHTTAPRLAWAEKGGVEQTLLPVDGRATLAFALDASRGVRISAGGGGPVVLLALEALADGPPEVTLEAPAEDRTVTTRPGRLELHASAQDDVGLVRLGFRWTLAEGQGEGMRFRSGLLGGKAVQGRAAEASAFLEPSSLGMKAGDTLVVWAEASDTNTLDGPGEGRSDVRMVRWEEAVADFTGLATGATLPPPTSQLSERELLARTERLVRSGARGEARRVASAELAGQQRHVRESFGFFLQMESQEGQELDVAGTELSESGDVRARRLLARAVSEMWTAEASLAMGNPAAALVPERAAVKALDEAFGSERLALRALGPNNKPVDEGRRLSGAQTGLRPRAALSSMAEAPDTKPVQTLARALLLAAETEMTAATARSLADAVWALPPASNLPVAALAAPLYAADDAASRSAAARAAGVALSRWLRPSPVGVPPVSPDEGPLLARLPLATPRP
jgi:hypothetical protein